MNLFTKKINIPYQSNKDLRIFHILNVNYREMMAEKCHECNITHKLISFVQIEQSFKKIF